jgi:hypothetical protein
MKHILLWTILIPFAGLAIALPVRAGGVEEDVIDWYDQQVYENLQQRDDYYKKLAASGYTGIRTPDGDPGYYTFGERTDGIAGIYEATGREYYLERLIEYTKLMMAAGKDNNGDGYVDYFHWMKDRESYCKWDYEPGYNYGAHCYWNAMRTIARCARVGRLGPHYEKYKAEIDEIVGFVTKQIIEKWEEGDQAMKLEQWLSLDHFTISGMHSHAGSLMVDAYLATGDDHIKDLATRFAEKVKGGWVLYSNGSYAWCGNGGIQVPKDCMDVSFELGDKKYGLQDTAHSIRVIRFAAIAHRAGLVVTDDDMERLVNTFSKNLWRGDDEKFADYVNGADDPGGRYTFSTITQWVRVGGFDEETHERLVKWTGGPRRPDKYSDDRIHYFGILALNLKLRKDGYKLHPWQAAPE